LHQVSQFLSSCFFLLASILTAKARRLREERKGLSLQRVAAFDQLPVFDCVYFTTFGFFEAVHYA
jgi:hypothetical protein